LWRPAELQRAITDTHTGYFKAGVMTQDLVWEQYAYPVGDRFLFIVQVRNAATVKKIEYSMVRTIQQAILKCDRNG